MAEDIFFMILKAGQVVVLIWFLSFLFFFFSFSCSYFKSQVLIHLQLSAQVKIAHVNKDIQSECIHVTYIYT